MKHDQEKNGENLSLFSRLSQNHPESLIRLSRQYRMNDKIQVRAVFLLGNSLLGVDVTREYHLTMEILWQGLANTLIYDGKLLSGSESVSSARLRLSEHALSTIKVFDHPALESVRHNDCGAFL